MGKAHKYFPFMQSDDRPNSSLFGGLNTTAKAFARATKGNKHHFHSQRIALTMFLAFLFIMAVACFNKLSFSTQTAWLFAPKNCCIGRFYGRCPNPQFLKKLSKLFCSFADNLALANFQCPTDTPLNQTFFIITVLISPIMAILIVRNCLGVIFCSMVKLKFAE